MKTFKHDFKSTFGILDVQGVNGYIKALREVYNYLAKVTEFNPEKRFIDAVPLLDLIGDTNAELAQIMSEEQENLSKDLINVSLHDNYC